MRSTPCALVTGAAGFTGRHLVAHLANFGYRVTGVDVRDWPAAPVPFQRCDLFSSQLEEVMAQVQPHVVLHLAALTDPTLPFVDFFRANVLGTLRLTQVLARHCPRARILVVSSSAVYGASSSSGLPLDEEAAFRPVSAYALSKLIQEFVAVHQATEHGLCLIRSRTFNITGPGESERFVTSAFARQIAEIEAGGQEPVIRVGNLESVRDFTDVRDVVRAYRLLVELGKPGEVYHVCSGRGTSIRWVLDFLLSLSIRRDITIAFDAQRFQPADVPIQIGSNARIRACTGWQPEIPLEQTLQDVLEYWRNRARVALGEPRSP